MAGFQSGPIRFLTGKQKIRPLVVLCHDTTYKRNLIGSEYRLQVVFQGYS